MSNIQVGNPGYNYFVARETPDGDWELLPKALHIKDAERVAKEYCESTKHGAAILDLRKTYGAVVVEKDYEK